MFLINANDSTKDNFDYNLCTKKEVGSSFFLKIETQRSTIMGYFLNLVQFSKIDSINCDSAKISQLIFFLMEFFSGFLKRFCSPLAAHAHKIASLLSGQLY